MSDALLQIIADVLERPILAVRDPQDAGARGAAACARRSRARAGPRVRSAGGRARSDLRTVRRGEGPARPRLTGSASSTRCSVRARTRARSRSSSSVWIRPFEATATPSMANARSPAVVVIRPPASSIRISGAARSHGWTRPSSIASARASATNPKPQSRRSRSRSPRVARRPRRPAGTAARLDLEQARVHDARFTNGRDLRHRQAAFAVPRPAPAPCQPALAQGRCAHDADLELAVALERQECSE